MPIWLEHVLRYMIYMISIGSIIYNIYRRKQPKRYIENPEITKEDVERQIEIERCKIVSQPFVGKP